MMNVLLELYFKLPHDSSFGITSKIINRIAARIVKRILDRTVPNHFLKTLDKYPTGVNLEPREKEIVISLTSFPGRIADVWIVIECLFRQTYKADKIILWLSKSQFEGVELPSLLTDQQSRGLDIRFVEGDIKSHKKYIYALNEFKNDYVITVDDDLYYDNKLIQNLIQLKEKYPYALPTNRAHLIQFDNRNKVASYSKWYHNYPIEKQSLLLVPTGGFGTLYEFDQLYQTFDNQILIKELVPHADDLWIKIQSLLKNTQVVTNNRYNKDPISVKSSQLEKLVSINVLRGGNDGQFRAVLNHFSLGELDKYRD